MAYEIFTRKIIRTTSPTITITPYGRLNLNKSIIGLFEKNAVEQVLLLFDGERRKLAVRPINKKDDPRAYPVAYNAKATGVGFAAKTFFDHFGIDYSTTRSFAATWNQDEMLLEAELPADAISTPQQRLLLLKRSKHNVKDSKVG